MGAESPVPGGGYGRYDLGRVPWERYGQPAKAGTQCGLAMVAPGLWTGGAVYWWRIFGPPSYHGHVTDASSVDPLLPVFLCGLLFQ